MDFIARNPVTCNPEALMITFALLALIACVGISCVPIYLLGRGVFARAREYFVASEHTPPGVIQNSSIAYSLQIATFGQFFAWGAKGEFWPAMIFSAMFGAGLYLIHRLRLPMRAFMSQGTRTRSVSHRPRLHRTATRQRCARAVDRGNAECLRFCGLDRQCSDRRRVVGKADPAGRPKHHVPDCMWPSRLDAAVHNTGREFRGHAFGAGATWNSVFWIDRIDSHCFVHADFVGWTNAAAGHVRSDRPCDLLRDRAGPSTLAIH